MQRCGWPAFRSGCCDNKGGVIAAVTKVVAAMFQAVGGVIAVASFGSHTVGRLQGVR